MSAKGTSRSMPGASDRSSMGVSIPLRFVVVNAVEALQLVYARLRSRVPGEARCSCKRPIRRPFLIWRRPGINARMFSQGQIFGGCWGGWGARRGC